MKKKLEIFLKESEGVKITKGGNMLLDVDQYARRERFYTGTRAGVVLLFDKAVIPKMMEHINMLYPRMIDIVIEEDGFAVTGVRVYRTGRIVQ